MARPEVDRRGGDGVGGDGDLWRADAAALGAGPVEEGDIGAGAAEFVAEVEVVALGVVVIDGGLDEPLTEDGLVEIQILPRLGGDCGDVVQAEDGGGGLGHGFILRQTDRGNMGGEEHMLKCWDVRAICDSADQSAPVWIVGDARSGVSRVCRPEGKAEI